MRCAVLLVLIGVGACWRGTDTDIVTANTSSPPLVGPTDIQGGVYLPRPAVGESAGRITNLTSEPGEASQKRWTFAVEGAPFVIELPGAIPFPAVEGDAVTIVAAVAGGRNAFGTLHMRDGSGALLLAVLALPDGWKQEVGALVSTQPGQRYDESRYRVIVTAPDRSTAEIGDGWRRVTLAGQSYLGRGSGAKRSLHGDPPPDYVGSWLDVALIRVR